MPTKIEISLKTLFLIFFFICGVYFVYLIRALVLEILVAAIIMVAINPTVAKIEKLKVGSYRPNRITSAFLSYLFYLLIISFFISLVVRPLAQETTSLITKVPNYASQLSTLIPLDGQGLTQIINQVGSFSNNLIGFVTSIFSNVIALLTTIVISFYLVLERPRLHQTLAHFLGNDDLSDKLNKLIVDIERELGGWVRAQVFLMIIVGFLSYIGFVILQLPHALSLAIVAGFLELIPNIGPTISTIPAALAGFSVSVWHGVGAICWCFIVQWLENNLIVPQIMSKSTGVEPLITIISLIIGFTLAGVPGAILAVPSVIIIRNILETFVYTKHTQS